MHGQRLARNIYQCIYCLSVSQVTAKSRDTRDFFIRDVSFFQLVPSLKRAGTRKREKKLRLTSPILMKIGSLVDFDLNITYPKFFSPIGPGLGVILGSEGQKSGKSGNLRGHFSAPKNVRRKKFREHQRCEIGQ